MAEQKKRGFHALEDRIHQLEEEEASKQRQAGSQQQGKDAGAERRGQGSEESQKTRE